MDPLRTSPRGLNFQGRRVIPAAYAIAKPASRALGYRENGRYREAPRGTPNVVANFELTREEWLQRRDALPRAAVTGLDACLAMFSLA